MASSGWSPRRPGGRERHPNGGEPPPVHCLLFEAADENLSKALITDLEPRHLTRDRGGLRLAAAHGRHGRHGAWLERKVAKAIVIPERLGGFGRLFFALDGCSEFAFLEFR